MMKLNSVFLFALVIVMSMSGANAASRHLRSTGNQKSIDIVSDIDASTMNRIKQRYLKEADAERKMMDEDKRLSMSISIPTSMSMSVPMTMPLSMSMSMPISASMSMSMSMPISASMSMSMSMSMIMSMSM